MKEKTLKEKTFSGLSWTAADKLFQQLFVFVSGILLARILGKDVYGLIGVLAIFTGMANILQESGLSAALIRKKDVTESDYTTVFYTNIFIGISLYIILFLTAPFIGGYYEQPILTPLARFLFLAFVFNSFSTIQNVRLLKTINYKLITKINFAAVLASYLIALFLAYHGYGVWALASQIVTIAFLRSSLLWIFGKWRPKAPFSFKTLQEFFSFGSKLMLSGILNSFTTNIPQNIIGKQYSLGLTGLYNQASKLFNTVSDFLNGTIQSVPFVVLSNIDEDARLKNAARKFVRAKAFLVFPIYMGMILVSEPFILSLLGVEWSGSIAILQLLSIGGLFSSLDASNNDILRIKGKSGKILSLDIFRNILIFIIIAITLTFRINYLYMIGGLSGTYIIKYLLSSYIANKTINYKLSELFKDLLPYLITTLLVISCGYLLRFAINNQLVLMISQVALVSILYISILYIFGSVIVKEAFSMIKSAIFKTK